MLPALQLRFWSRFAVALLAGSPSALAAHPAQGCSQPMATNLQAVYREGHTFITWNETGALNDETYAVYYDDQPITDVQNATRIVLNGGFDEIPEDSSVFYADMVPEFEEHCVWNSCCSAFVARHTDRLWVLEADGDRRKLTPGEGVLVLTPATAGTRYYAVTTIVGVTEYTCLNSGLGGNVTTVGVAEQVEDPEPIPLTEKACSSPLVGVYLQYMNPLDWNVTLDAPSRLNCYYGFDNPFLPSLSNRMTKAIQYAYTYEVAIPSTTPPMGGWPVTLVLHGNGGVQADCSPANQGSVLIRPYDYLGTQWYGCARMYDYRQADPLDPFYPERGFDWIINYTEQRVLRALYDTCRTLNALGKVDLDRLYVRGHSMGGGGTLGMALHYPDVFAAAHASKPPTAFGDAETYEACVAGSGGQSYLGCFPGGLGSNFVKFLWGDFEELECDRVLNDPYLPPFGDPAFAAWDDVLEYYEEQYPYPNLPFNVYQWQDHRAQLHAARGAPICNGLFEAPFIDRRFDDTVPIGIYHSYNDPIIEYCLHARPLYPKLNGGYRTAAAQLLSVGGHTNLAAQLPLGYSLGMPPPLQAITGNVPFHGHTVKRSETVPGLQVSTLADYAPCLGEPYPAASYLTQIDWESSWHPLACLDATAPVESNTEDVRWEMFFDNLTNSSVTVNITPRRLQVFTPKLEELPYAAEVHYFQDGFCTGSSLGTPVLPSPYIDVQFDSNDRLLLVITDVTLEPNKTYRVRIINSQ